MRGTVRLRSHEEIGDETRKQKIRCLNLCYVDDRDIEGKLVENDPTFVVTGNQHPRETRQALKIHQHDNMEYFIHVVNNCKLDPARVREPRKAEMEYFQKMHVYKKVPVEKCKDVTGTMLIKVRWIDTHKQDEVNPNYHRWLVAKGVQDLQ